MWQVSPEEEAESLFNDCQSSHDNAPTKILTQRYFKHPLIFGSVTT